MAESTDKLYRAEYAKSGRASCKKCGDNIAKQTLRLAIMVQVGVCWGSPPSVYHRGLLRPIGHAGTCSPTIAFG